MANKVYNDLNETPFTLDYEGFTLYFSSIFHKNKFKDNIKRYIKEETLRFEHKYKVKVSMNDIFIIAYYKKCETRGFKAFRDKLLLSPDKEYKNIML